MTPQQSRSGQLHWIPDTHALGSEIRRARKAQGLTQSTLAGLAGTGLRFISELERGKPSVALDKTLSVLAVLGLRIGIAAPPP